MVLARRCSFQWDAATPCGKQAGMTDHIMAFREVKDAGHTNRLISWRILRTGFWK